MRKRSLAAGTAALAAALTTAAVAAVPATADAPARSTTPMCQTSQLSAHLGGSDAGAGNLYRYLVITNTSGTACHVTGFPGLSMLDAQGKQIGAPATRDHNSYASVVLRPGASASDTIHTINHQGTCLPTSTSLRVYPPDNRASLVIPGKVTNCDNLFSVTPFVAGTTGNPSNSAPAPTPVPTRSGGQEPTPVPSPTSVGATPTPVPGRQITAVPSGAPDTGLAPTASASDSHTTAIVGGAAAGGALLLGGLGLAARRRSARTRG
ncbi:DUF4232 domain-containing protein [Actinacidiphila acididurans]|uniref:DUF4232 domain-containing protein n=1 Tax=Actinacidiphila acididurans TaxID=2784346 RepID=A0ABS2U482_9ACTN|nr:DUF4232 domain-containing protein [Actinacidiphila acididurans]MBM9510418.1 DUF4232 domain-containing protein [Actinacidiphila acididurans]